MPETTRHQKLLRDFQKTRLTRGHTQAQAGKILGHSSGSISNWEAGRYAPSPIVRVKMRRYIAELSVPPGVPFTPESTPANGATTEAAHFNRAITQFRSKATHFSKIADTLEELGRLLETAE